MPRITSPCVAISFFTWTCLALHRMEPPGLVWPRLALPRLASPSFALPGLDSPCLASPRLAYPGSEVPPLSSQVRQTTRDVDTGRRPKPVEAGWCRHRYRHQTGEKGAECGRDKMRHSPSLDGISWGGFRKLFQICQNFSNFSKFWKYQIMLEIVQKAH